MNPEIGPESIEGYYDEALAVPGLLAEIGKGEARGVAGHVIACFDDTGLDAARALARAPVVGIGEAAFHLASLIAGRFSVITTLGRSVPAIEQNLVKYGLASRCARVRAAEIPVLALEDKDSDARARIEAEIDAREARGPRGGDRAGLRGHGGPRGGAVRSATGCPSSMASPPRWCSSRRSPASASGRRSWAAMPSPSRRPSGDSRSSPAPR